MFQFKVTIPYRARVVSGRLFVDEATVRFHLKEEPNSERPKISRNLTVKNEFSVSVKFLPFLSSGSISIQLGSFTSPE